jgi:hypothetical protein
VESPVLTRVQNSTYHLDHFSGGLPDRIGVGRNRVFGKGKRVENGHVVAPCDVSTRLLYG